MKLKHLALFLGVSILTLAGCGTTPASSSGESSSLVPSSESVVPSSSSETISSTPGSDSVVPTPSSTSVSPTPSSSSVTPEPSSSSVTPTPSSSSIVPPTPSSSSSGPAPVLPLTVSEALTIAKSLPEKGISTKSYTIYGIVSNGFDPKEGTTKGEYSFDVVDYQGGEFLIVWYLKGNRLPKKGESVTIYSKLQNYSTNKYECVEGSFTVGSAPTPSSSSIGPSPSSSSLVPPTPGEETVTKYVFKDKSFLSKTMNLKSSFLK